MMQTLTISGSENFMDKLRLFITQNADESVQVVQKNESIIAELEADIAAYRQGRLETYSFDEMKEKCLKW